ncbi:MAG: hypothetical protein U1E27_01465, partial [Kiritimatiellia bacterium]|nr:hypothetical protein [Kiritimatiellia bacterium]
MSNKIARFAFVSVFSAVFIGLTACETTEEPATTDEPAPAAEKTTSGGGGGSIGGSLAGVAPNPALGTVGSGGGFIWKPVSESDGKLVVLLPAGYKGKVNGCWIARGDGSVVENGRFVGDTHNGNRPHYRFSKPGAQYGTGIFVV